MNHGLPRPARRHRFCAQTRRRLTSRAGGRALRRSRRGHGGSGAGGSRPLCRRRDRAAQSGRRQMRHPVQGWRRHHPARTAAGWNGVAAAAEYGGQELPHAVNAACIEMWNSGSMAFGIGPALTMAAIDALAAYGSDDLKKAYLEKLISGEWMGTMQLTEPQAGSDVGALRTRATRADDGSYRIAGSKIFITYGEHDLTPNTIPFVLARLPDAPPGTKGVSLF